jgi:hypothetical protein
MICDDITDITPIFKRFKDVKRICFKIIPYSNQEIDPDNMVLVLESDLSPFHN